MFYNIEAKRGYKNLIKGMNKAERKALVAMLEEMTRTVDEKMSEVDESVVLSAVIEHEGLIHPLTVIGYCCEHCDTKHIEILEVRSPVFSLN